jgi:hypothetical protein
MTEALVKDEEDLIAQVLKVKKNVELKLYPPPSPLSRRPLPTPGHGDPHNFDADPDSTYHPDAYPDSDFYLLRYG